MIARTITAFRKAHENRALLLALPGEYPNLPLAKGAGERLARVALDSGRGVIVVHPDNETTLMELPDPEWVRVADELPDEDVTVLACWNGDPETIESACLNGSRWKRSMEDVVFQTPSHWRHLPDAPHMGGHSRARCKNSP